MPSEIAYNTASVIGLLSIFQAIHLGKATMLFTVISGKKKVYEAETCTMSIKMIFFLLNSNSNENLLDRP